MKEVVIRRLSHSVPILNENKRNGFGEVPDLILADGGITQIRATEEAIGIVNEMIKEKSKELGVKPNLIKLPVYGMVKNDKHQTRALMNDNREELEISQELLNLITLFQDNVHNTAIGYHKKLRDKEITKSKLDEITGIGEKKKRDLLLAFGSVEEIKKASIEEITNVKGINRELAEKIKSEL
jgi:excinuclease ABC subunit C